MSSARARGSARSRSGAIRAVGSSRTSSPRPRRVASPFSKMCGNTAGPPQDGETTATTSPGSRCGGLTGRVTVTGTPLPLRGAWSRAWPPRRIRRRGPAARARRMQASRNPDSPPARPSRAAWASSARPGPVRVAASPPCGRARRLATSRAQAPWTPEGRAIASRDAASRPGGTASTGTSTAAVVRGPSRPRRMPGPPGPTAAVRPRPRRWPRPRRGPARRAPWPGARRPGGCAASRPSGVHGSNSDSSRRRSCQRASSQSRFTTRTAADTANHERRSWGQMRRTQSISGPALPSTAGWADVRHSRSVGRSCRGSPAARAVHQTQLLAPPASLARGRACTCRRAPRRVRDPGWTPATSRSSSAGARQRAAAAHRDAVGPTTAEPPSAWRTASPTSPRSSEAAARAASRRIGRTRSSACGSRAACPAPSARTRPGGRPAARRARPARSSHRHRTGGRRASRVDRRSRRWRPQRRVERGSPRGSRSLGASSAGGVASTHDRMSAANQVAIPWFRRAARSRSDRTRIALVSRPNSAVRGAAEAQHAVQRDARGPPADPPARGRPRGARRGRPARPRARWARGRPRGRRPRPATRRRDAIAVAADAGRAPATHSVGVEPDGRRAGPPAAAGPRRPRRAAGRRRAPAPPRRRAAAPTRAARPPQPGHPPTDARGPPMPRGPPPRRAPVRGARRRPRAAAPGGPSRRHARPARARCARSAALRPASPARWTSVRAPTASVTVGGIGLRSRRRYASTRAARSAGVGARASWNRLYQPARNAGKSRSSAARLASSRRSRSSRTGARSSRARDHVFSSGVYLS